MSHNLKNIDYDDYFLINQFAKESPLFDSYLQQAIKDTDHAFPTNEIWLGTLQLGKDKITTQIQLIITQEPSKFIDENG